MRATGYNSYRKESRLRKFLKGFAISLLVLLVLCVGALFFLQRYIVYTADGPRLELPLFQPAPTQSEAPPPVVVSEPVVVSPPPTPPAPVTAGKTLLFLPREVMFSGTAAAKLNAANAEGAIYDMKVDSGELGYVSGLELAIRAGATASDVSLGSAITAYLREADYTVARVSCFKDNRLARADHNLNILTNSGYQWTDPDKLRWTSPTNEAVRLYLTELCVELAQLGFDEILLEHATYPPSGNLGYIRRGPQYDKAAFESVITGFYSQVKEALAPYGTKLSIMTDADTLTAGYNETTGQGTANLALADRIYLETADPAPYIALMETAGMENPAENVIAVGTSFSAEVECRAVREEATPTP